MIKRMSKFTALLLSALMILSVIATGLTSAVAAEVILCVQSKQFFSLLLIDNLHYIQENERENIVSHHIFQPRELCPKDSVFFFAEFNIFLHFLRNSFQSCALIVVIILYQCEKIIKPNLCLDERIPFFTVVKRRKSFICIYLKKIFFQNFHLSIDLSFL